MSRYSLYTAARRRPEGIPPSGAPRGDSVLRSGGVAVRRAALCTGARRPDPRDPDRAPPGSARSRSRAESYVCVRRVCAVGVRPLVAPSLGIRANSGLSSGRCRARAPRGRVADTYTGCTLVDATDGTRAMDAWRDAWLPILVAHSTAGPRADGSASGWRAGTASYRLSLIPAIERKKSTLSHIAPRGEPLSFLRRSVMTSRVRRHPTAPRLVLKCL